ncbi:MAG: SDR family oxidoreductase [Maribacter sp.]|uniref:SDR family oxidoreductase n=1 Tax=Maribacter sp. TaxID=1897614 RepID=UPI003C76CA72
MEKVILVTGSSRGIGKEIAILLAENGGKIVVNYANNEKEANDTVEQIKNSGGTAIAFKADVSKREQVTALFDKAIEHYGRVDVLINNAGIMITKLLNETSEDDFIKQFDVNVKGTFNTLQEAFSRLSNNGIIINFSSSTVKMMLPSYALYSATKAAVEQMTRVFSKEIGRGISVNAIAPGPTNTELFLNGKSEDFIKRLVSLNAFNRLAEPSDIAKVVHFLASDNSKWISGQVIGVNGAMV